MRKVFVLNHNREPMMPCHPARARKLLREEKAAVLKRFPFTIILKEQLQDIETQEVELKVDPGSKVSGIVLVGEGKRGKKVLWASNLEHRGFLIKKALEQRRGIRRSRRNRKTRYRPARFLNRKKPKGWLPPSLMSRVNNTATIAKRLFKLIPITSIAVETVRFDTQKMENPEISGKEYQQGTLEGYEIREYLLEKWGRKCAYCEKENVPLQIEHIIPRSRGGSNRVGNLTLSCGKCNTKKGTKTATEFGFPGLQKVASKTLNYRDAAMVNATRYATGKVLKSFGLPTEFWSGGRTKKNRITQGYEKDHWIDAACVGETGEKVHIPDKLVPLIIKAKGRGIRQFCKVDKRGFPRTGPKPRNKTIKGFKSGDLVIATKKKGKYKGKHFGRLGVRSSGSFDIVNKTGHIPANWKDCKIVHLADGYSYEQG